MSFLVDGHWHDVPNGGFILAPAGSEHDFENRGTVRAGLLNLSVPGTFERSMPNIAKRFAEHPPGDAKQLQ